MADETPVPACEGAALPRRRGRPMQMDPAEREAAVLDCAVELLSERGIDGVTIANCLFLGGGYGLADGAALRMEDGSGWRVLNSIAVSNNVGLYCGAAPCTNDHDIVWGNITNYQGAAAAGTGSLKVDPRFASPAEGDFSLLSLFLQAHIVAAIAGDVTAAKLNLADESAEKFLVIGAV